MDDGLADRGRGIQQLQAEAGAGAIVELSPEAGGNYMKLMTTILGQELLTQRRIE